LNFSCTQAINKRTALNFVLFIELSEDILIPFDIRIETGSPLIVTIPFLKANNAQVASSEHHPKGNSTKPPNLK
jgi:hypothetical protein